MPLPTQISQKILDPQLLTIVIYGGPGIGKSTFASLADSTVFLPTEPGLDAITGYKWKDENGNDKLIESWEELWLAYKELREGKHSYRSVCIDTGNNAFKLCQNYICRKNNVQHETDIPGNAKGYTLINNEFYRLMKSFAALPMGFFLTFHTRESKVKTKTQEWNKMTLDLPDTARGQMIALASFVLYLEVEEYEDENDSGKRKSRRLMHSQPHTLYEAKYRYKPLPDPIYISGKNSYQEFLSEFKKANGVVDSKTTQPSTQKK